MLEKLSRNQILKTIYLQRKDINMKHFDNFLVFISFALVFHFPLFANDIWDIVEQAQQSIDEKYPSKDSIARKLALKELEEIAGSNKTDEEKMEDIIVRFSLKQSSVNSEVVQPKILKKAFEELVTSAEQGDASSQVYLASCYMVGENVKQDKSEAVKWYRKAAEQGYAPAQCALASCYTMGMGVGNRPAWYILKTG